VTNSGGFATNSALQDSFNPFYDLSVVRTRSELEDLIVDWAREPSEKNANRIINANTSEITNMSYLFNQFIGSGLEDEAKLNIVMFDLDISAWDVSSVTNMSSMFTEVDAFDGNISIWDVSNVTDMSGMFFGTSVFNQDISGWDVSSVTNSSYFSTNSALEAQNMPTFP